MALNHRRTWFQPTPDQELQREKPAWESARGPHVPSIDPITLRRQQRQDRLAQIAAGLAAAGHSPDSIPTEAERILRALENK